MNPPPTGAISGARPKPRLASPLGAYAAALLADDRADAELHAREASGHRRPVEVARWLAPADRVDERLLDRAAGPVLDVGCGPGRHVRALAARSVMALGVDASPAAVELARARGTAVHEGSIFAAVPGAGAWRTALLLDGNIGIGGDPASLLGRIVALLTPDGSVLVETDAPGLGMRTGPVRLEGPQLVSAWFAWARVGSEAIDEPAHAAGLTVADRWSDEGRWFVELVRER